MGFETTGVAFLLRRNKGKSWLDFSFQKEALALNMAEETIGPTQKLRTLASLFMGFLLFIASSLVKVFKILKLA